MASHDGGDLRSGLILLVVGVVTVLAAYLAIPMLWLFFWIVALFGAALGVAGVILLLSALSRRQAD